MNYPIWELPGSGLLIALVSIIHVFISHFAVGGGLLLVLAERKARREHDDALLGFVQSLGRFFILLTLVLGAVTGVGIWFTITLVHPPATSALIQIFVWAWAMEWTLFVAEIAAAMVYYYGWERLSPRVHMAVGWIYFGAAWGSLFLINGILAFMLTPGDWIVTRDFWDGFFNPTFWPSLVVRTFAAMGLAGVYVLFYATGHTTGELRWKILRWSGLRWVLPMAVVLPLALMWYLTAAGTAGIPLGDIFSAKSPALGDLIAAILRGPGESGYPMAQRAALAVWVSALVSAGLTLILVFWKTEHFGRPLAILLMVSAFLSIGSGEWIREGLRKPYVIGNYMFVNGVRLPASPGTPAPPEKATTQIEDPFTVDNLNQKGVLLQARWARLPAAFRPGDLTAASMDQTQLVQQETEAGGELFKMLCSACHSIDGYNAVRPLVRGKSAEAIDGLLGKLASPVDSQGKPTTWSDPNLRLNTWRHRRMPPFVGTEVERRALALFLAQLGGGDLSAGAPPRAAHPGARLYEENCAMCHGPESEWPLAPRIRGRTSAQFFDILGQLPQINDQMPAFEGSDDERRALADYLAELK